MENGGKFEVFGERSFWGFFWGRDLGVEVSGVGGGPKKVPKWPKVPPNGPKMP